MLPDYLAKTLHKIAKNLHFTDYSLDIENASSHGNNFAGVVLAVTVNGVRVQNGRHVPDKLHLVCKTPVTDEKLRQSFQAKMVFDRELYIYANVLPAFVAFRIVPVVSESVRMRGRRRASHIRSNHGRLARAQLLHVAEGENGAARARAAGHEGAGQTPCHFFRHERPAARPIRRVQAAVGRLWGGAARQVGAILRHFGAQIGQRSTEPGPSTNHGEFRFS